MILYATASGTMMSIDVEQAIRTIDAFVSNNYQARHNKQSVQKK